MEFVLLGLGEGGEFESRRRGQVREVGARTAGDRVDDDAVGDRPAGAGEEGRGVLELVEPVDPDHPVLAHGRVDDLVGAGELAGVGGGGTRSGLGAADLHGDDGDALAGGPVGGEEEGAAVLESFDVTGDGADLGPSGEVRDEVGGLQVGLVAGGRPVGEADAQLLEGEDGPPLVAGLGDERDGGPFEVLAEAFEGVEVGVGAEEPEPGLAYGGGETFLRGGAGLAGLGEAGGEGDREPDFGGGQLLDDRQRVGDEEDGEVDGFGEGADGRDAVDPEHAGTGRVHGHDPGADPLGPGEQLPGDAGVGPPLGVGGADDGDGLGPEEPVEVGYGRVQRAPADVLVAGGGGDAVHDDRGRLAAGDHAGAETGGERAVSRSKHVFRPPFTHPYTADA